MFGAVDGGDANHRALGQRLDRQTLAAPLQAGTPQRMNAGVSQGRLAVVPECDLAQTLAGCRRVTMRAPLGSLGCLPDAPSASALVRCDARTDRVEVYVSHPLPLPARRTPPPASLPEAGTVAAESGRHPPRR